MIWVVFFKLSSRNVPAIGFIICHNYPAASFTLGAIKRSVGSPQDGCTGETIFREDRNTE
jgi:hypothetical protein